MSDLHVDPTPEKWTPSDLVALSSLTELTHGYVPWTAWSMRPAAVASIVNEIELSRRRRVVEIGAGSSTVHLGHALAGTGGTLLSIEHDERHAGYVRRLIDREGLDDVVSLHVVPVRARPVTPPDGSWALPTAWYDLSGVPLPDDVDVLVVDGPPAGFAPDTLVRLPALEALAPHLCPDSTIFLDDADRPAEQEILRRWGATTGTTFTVTERIGLGSGRAGGAFVPTL